ncbi:MAG: hypothetical protein VX589_01395 [Myxococcota bacterium]|nr:hypothetical protein [Myxococcota bacterium]
MNTIKWMPVDRLLGVVFAMMGCTRDDASLTGRALVGFIHALTTLN